MTAAHPDAVTIRAMTEQDLPAVQGIYAEGITTRLATFETEVPDLAQLATKWLPDQRWVAELDGEVVGWAAIAPTSRRACYAGVGETSVYVAAATQGRGIGRVLLEHLVTEAFATGMWTLQASVIRENRASIALHEAAGFEVLTVRRRIARLDGKWRDTVLLERRAAADPPDQS